MRKIGWMIAAAGIAWGCGPDAVVDSDCQVICQQLVHTCDYAAFPTYDSCLQGCTHNGTEGADIRGQRECLEAVGCDTFAVVECEHAHGPQ